MHLEPKSWPLFPDNEMGPEHAVEYPELLAALGEGIASALTPHQRHVLAALDLNGVPIDVLADRLGSTRGALYKTLHDARESSAPTSPPPCLLNPWSPRRRSRDDRPAISPGPAPPARTRAA